jgi:hypothetical protein
LPLTDVTGLLHCYAIPAILEHHTIRYTETKEIVQKKALFFRNRDS